MHALKPVDFRGSSLHDLRAFPLEVRRDIGYQIDRVQRGGEPDDWKAMPSIGAGVKEIRIQDAHGAFRAIYIAKFEAVVYVLHCFQKKSSRTSRVDIQLARKRYHDLREELAK